MLIITLAPCSYITAPGFAELERATVVLATPPCSYTGLTNIVDLIVARGGDTELLESLTNVDDQAQLERPRKLLAEQMSCLKYTLMKPNVQLLIYEAHSTLPSETVEMLQQVVQYANKMAVDKHTRQHLVIFFLNNYSLSIHLSFIVAKLIFFSREEELPLKTRVQRAVEDHQDLENEQHSRSHGPRALGMKMMKKLQFLRCRRFKYPTVICLR